MIKTRIVISVITGTGPSGLLAFLASAASCSHRFQIRSHLRDLHSSPRAGPISLQQRWYMPARCCSTARRPARRLVRTLRPRRTELLLMLMLVLTHNHQARSPNRPDSATQNQVQYKMSQRNSVRPLASRSSPDLWISPGSDPYRGRPMLSSQNSIRAAGADNSTYRAAEPLPKLRRKKTMRMRM
jgi:hypothetical protein